MPLLSNTLNAMDGQRQPRFQRLICASSRCTGRHSVSPNANAQIGRRPPAVRFRTVDVQDLFEDSRRAPVSRLAPGYTVYRRPRMEDEGVPANADLV